MPPFFAVLAGAIGSIAALRFVVKTVRRVGDEIERGRQAHLAENSTRESLPTLRRDPTTGAYRPG